MQRYPIPHSGFLNLWGQHVAHLGKSRLQSKQTLKLLRRGVEGNADEGIHIGSKCSISYMNISSLFFNGSKKAPLQLPQSGALDSNEHNDWWSECLHGPAILGLHRDCGLH